MFKFLKENSYTAVTLFIYQVGMTVFGLITSMAAGSFKDQRVLLFASVFAALFYLYLLYVKMNDFGQKDKVKVEAGRAKPNTLNYAVLALVANSINLILGILAVIGKLFIENIGFFEEIPLENFVPTPEWAASLYGTCDIIARFIQAMYLGIISVLFDGNPLILVIIPLLSVASCTFGYYVGMKKGPKGLLGLGKEGNTKKR